MQTRTQGQATTHSLTQHIDIAEIIAGKGKRARRTAPAPARSGGRRGRVHRLARGPRSPGPRRARRGCGAAAGCPSPCSRTCNSQPRQAEQRQAIRGRRPGSVGAACGGRLLGQEGDELVAVRVEGVLDAVADARVAVQLRRRHGCRAARQWSVDRSFAAARVGVVVPVATGELRSGDWREMREHSGRRPPTLYKARGVQPLAVAPCPWTRSRRGGGDHRVRVCACDGVV